MILAHPVLGKQKSIDLCNAFIEGAPRSARAFVFYGVNQSNMREFRTAKANGAPWFYIDGSYFDKVRGQQYRITKNAFQIRAVEHSSDGQRFRALGVTPQPWKLTRANTHILAVEQSATFMADIAGNPQWLRERVRRAKETGAAVRVRPWSSDKPKLATTLAQDIEGASVVLTHSSAAAVEALIAGVSAIVSPMSAIYGIDPKDRLEILGVLADNQFSTEQMRSGEAWKWLNKK